MQVPDSQDEEEESPRVHGNVPSPKARLSGKNGNANYYSYFCPRRMDFSFVIPLGPLWSADEPCPAAGQLQFACLAPRDELQNSARGRLLVAIRLPLAHNGPPSKEWRMHHGTPPRGTNRVFHWLKENLKKRTQIQQNE